MKRFISVLLVCLVSVITNVHAQSIADVLKAFRKLEADTEAGVNYSEYARSMAEANAQLKTFADANPGRPPAAILALRSAFDMYTKAKYIWDDEKLQTMRYNNGEVSISDYFDGKRANTTEISSLWKRAGEEISRAASLQNIARRTKGK